MLVDCLQWMSTIRWMRQVIQAEKIALQLAEDEYFFTSQKSEEVINK